jgi:hypothetical protein
MIGADAREIATKPAGCLSLAGGGSWPGQR